MIYVYGKRRTPHATTTHHTALVARVGRWGGNPHALADARSLVATVREPLLKGSVCMLCHPRSLCVCERTHLSLVAPLSPLSPPPLSLSLRRGWRIERAARRLDVLPRRARSVHRLLVRRLLAALLTRPRGARVAAKRLHLCGAPGRRSWRRSWCGRWVDPR